MEAEFVRHVRDFILRVVRFLLDLQRTFYIAVKVYRWPFIARFFQLTFEDFHDAMGVGMAM